MEARCHCSDRQEGRWVSHRAVDGHDDAVIVVPEAGLAQGAAHQQAAAADCRLKCQQCIIASARIPWLKYLGLVT